MQKRIKAQSAMEYLMTYGWAILIIAVVLGALFSLGVFSGSSLIGTSCIAAPGYYCQNPVLDTSGTLTFSFGQNTGSTIYNVTICAEPESISPDTAYPFFGPTNPNCTTTAYNSLNSGQTVSPSITITGFSGKPVGTPFTGYVWMSYNTNSQSSPSNLLAKVATIVVKVS
jgi:hypothetical protein